MGCFFPNRPVPRRSSFHPAAAHRQPPFFLFYAIRTCPAFDRPASISRSPEPGPPPSGHPLSPFRSML